MWHVETQAARERGDLVLLGVIQEQHPDRCRLFAQWQGFDWPILHDPINRLKARAVPIFVAIDEAGIVRDASLSVDELEPFLHEKPAAVPRDPAVPTAPQLEALEQAATGSTNSDDWVDLADARILWGEPSQVTAAVAEYRRALRLAPREAGILFRLGVAHRLRHDSPFAQEGDFQAAVDAWGQALDVDPNHYIYRRRIQQYGPRLIKPYPFYDWVQQARAELRERGETPLELTVEPSGAEIAQPAREFESEESEPAEPDPSGRILRDIERRIRATAVVVPGEITPGESVRVHVEMRPTKSVHWNNEAEPLRLWVDVPGGWQVASRLLTAPQPPDVESRELRRVEFELRAPMEEAAKPVTAYALYYICEERGGQCLYRRQDIPIPIRFKKGEAP